MYKISNSVACKALSQNPILGSSTEDMITVTLVCGSQLYVVRLCMRPHISFHFDQITSEDKSGTHITESGVREVGSFDYNDYYVTIAASNQ